MLRKYLLILFINELKNKSKEELELIVKDEDSKTIAKVMCFSNPDAASKIIEDFPEKIRENIIKEIQIIDYYSEVMRAELESFLFFKYDLIESRHSTESHANFEFFTRAFFAQR